MWGQNLEQTTPQQLYMSKQIMFMKKWETAASALDQKYWRYEKIAQPTQGRKLPLLGYG